MQFSASGRESAALSVASWPWQDIFWRLAAPAGAEGYLNWVSGMIVLPTDEDPEADAATDSDDPDHVSRVVLREHIHELTHYYQVLMCGSIYKSVEIASSVVLPRALAMINDLGRAGAPFSTIVEAVAQVGAAASADELDRILFRHETLETPDEGGLSADCLTEGHAFWVETVIGRTDLDGP